ncbi:MlaD family protein [Candidatus Omnitrophota bacterium]
MIFGKTKLELKVGVFVFAGIAILVIFVLSLGSFKTWASGYQVNFIFDFVNGVKRGAPVRFAGVEVGEVKEINFVFEATNKLQVQIVTWIEHEVNIPVDSTVWVNTLGLLGEKYIEIMPR